MPFERFILSVTFVVIYQYGNLVAISIWFSITIRFRLFQIDFIATRYKKSEIEWKEIKLIPHKMHETTSLSESN